MKKFNQILCLNYGGKEFPADYWTRIKKLAKRTVLGTGEFSVTDALLVKLGVKVGKEFIDQYPKLKYIGMLGTGIGGIDLTYAQTKNITVKNITDYATYAVAENTFGMILEYLRELERAKKQAREGDYSEATFTGREIYGKNFGIIGLGNIGRQTAKIALGFGAKVNYWSKHRKKDTEKLGCKYQSLDKILKNSDFLSLNLTLNPKTKNFLNKKRIKMIKNNCVIVNPSPMELIDFKALIARLKKRDLIFILDHSDEMNSKDVAEIKKYSGAIIYPPIGYTTHEATECKRDVFIKNIECFLSRY